MKKKLIQILMGLIHEMGLYSSHINDSITKNFVEPATHFEYLRTLTMKSGYSFKSAKLFSLFS